MLWVCGVCGGIIANGSGDLHLIETLVARLCPGHPGRKSKAEDAGSTSCTSSSVACGTYSVGFQALIFEQRNSKAPDISGYNQWILMLETFETEDVFWMASPLAQSSIKQRRSYGRFLLADSPCWRCARKGTAGHWWTVLLNALRHDLDRLGQHKTLHLEMAWKACTVATGAEGATELNRLHRSSQYKHIIYII